MKRIFIYLSVLASVAFGVSACVDQVFPKGTDPTPAVKASDIDIVISDVKDSSFTATITPQAEGNYYSYLVTEGPANGGKTIDSVALYKCTYSGLESGTAKSVKGASTVVEMTGLNPASTYYVYAVNSSTEGNVGKVAQVAVKTTDVVSPDIVAWKYDGNTVTIIYSEDVVWDKTKEISYGIYYKCFLTGTAYKVKAVTDSVIVDGSEVTIVCKEAKDAGAAYNLNFPEGTFTDIVGNKVAALESKFVASFNFDAKDPDAAFDKTYTGICGVLDNVDLGTIVKLPQVPEAIIISDFNAQKYVVTVPTGVTRCDLVDEYTTVYNRTLSSGAKVEEVVPMKKVTNYYGGYYTVTVKPSGTPVANDVMTIVIPAGAIRDWWGNENDDDIELGPVTIVSPSLTFEDIKVGCNNIEVTATPNADIYYYFGYCQNVQDSTDETLIQNAKDLIEYYAGVDQITFAEEYEQYFACKGDVVGDILNLTSEAQYNPVFYAFFMTSDGTVMSPVYRQENPFTTAKFEAPTETTGTYTYAISPFKSFGAVSGMPVSFNEDNSQVTISGYGLGVDLVCNVDKSGNILVPTTYTGYTHKSYGAIYTTEIYTWNGSWSHISYYNSLDNTIYLSIVNHIASGAYFGYGNETFCFDNSQPAAATSSVKSVNINGCKLSKYVANPKMDMRRHFTKR